MAEPAKKGANPLWWVLTTNFAEGLPYTVVRLMVPPWLTDLGVSERWLGATNFLGLAWNFKFVWSPLVDALGSKRGWMVGVQLILSLGFFLLAVCAGWYGADRPWILITAAVLLVLIAIPAATNDVAIDGYYQDGIPDLPTQAAYAGTRVLAYRLAWIYGRAGLIALAGLLAGWFPRHAPGLGWGVAFALAAAAMGVVTAVHSVFLPSPQQASHQAKALWRTFIDAFASYFDQRRVVIVLLFAATYRLGEEVMLSMASPFLQRELHVSTTAYAWVSGLIGASGTVIGAMIGGLWIRKVGLRRAIWPLTLIMNVNILLYVVLALVAPDGRTWSGLGTISAVHGFEMMAGGFGSAALLVFLLGTCKPEFRAAHYAIGSAIMSLGGTLFGGLAGFIVESPVRYVGLYVLAFVLAAPGMFLLPFVPMQEDKAR